MKNKFRATLSLVLAVVMLLSAGGTALAAGFGGDLGGFDLPDLEPIGLADRMPERDLSAQDDTGLSVRVHAPVGALPADVELKIERVEAEAYQAQAAQAVNADVSAALAVDIRFEDAAGKKYEPAAELEVSISAPELRTISNPQIVHISETRGAEVVQRTPRRSGASSVTFHASDFSIYVVVSPGEDENGRMEVTFVSAGEEIATMHIKQEDSDPAHLRQIIYDPGMGTAVRGIIFMGWTTEQDYTESTPALDIEGVRSAVAERLSSGVVEGDTMTFYAMRFKVFNVVYLDEVGAIIESKVELRRADSDETTMEHTVQLDYVPKNQDAHHEGWRVIDDEGNPTSTIYSNGDTVTLDGNLVLIAYVPSGYWLSFNENGRGASYTPPQFVKQGDVTVRPSTDPRRTGYTFAGWYENPEGTGSAFTFGQALNERKDLYAKWTPKSPAEYTVIVWKQSVDGAGYDFVKAIRLSGPANSTISSVTQRGSGDGAYARINGTDYRYTGFHLKGTDGITYSPENKIAPEGSTVVNVWYDRNEYTLTFQVDDYTYTETTANSGTQYGVVDNKHVRLYRMGDQWVTANLDEYNGTRYTRSNRSSLHAIKTITGLYEQNIASNFPIVGTDGITYEGNVWEPGNNSSVFTTGDVPTLEIMPAESTTFRLKDYGGSTTVHLIYYLEALDGDPVDTSVGGVDYTEHQHVKVNGAGSSTKAEDFFAITGFEQAFSDPAYNSNGTVDFSYSNNYTIKLYYTRNKYVINYMDGVYLDGNGSAVEGMSSRGQLHVSDEILFGADMSDYKDDYTPEYSGYHFEGWYLDSACNQEYEFDNTMPDGGVTLYAKWRQIQYRVFLHPQVPSTDESLEWGQTNQQMNFRVTWGNKVSGGNMVVGERAAYELIGWYTDEGCTAGHEFNFSVFTFNDDTVPASPAYDKTVDMTDTMDKYGQVSDPKSNSDVNRSWITRKLDIYAKWRSILVGADGIHVDYDATSLGTNEPYDPVIYADQATAIAQAAPTPNDSDLQFLHWNILRWNESTQEWEDTGNTVFPGNVFSVYAADARVTPEDEPGSSASFRYTVKLEAAYGSVLGTDGISITYNANGGKFTSAPDGFELNEDGTIARTVEINEAMDVVAADYVVAADGDGNPIAGSRGYKLLGWSTTPDNAEGSLFIDLSTFTGQIAADLRDLENNSSENTLYAVWQEVFYLYHSATGEFETIILGEAGDRWKHVTGYDTENDLYTTHYYGGFGLYAEADQPAAGITFAAGDVDPGTIPPCGQERRGLEFRGERGRPARRCGLPA